MRFIRGHATRQSGVDYLVDRETGCWRWQLAKDGRGYGQVHNRDGYTGKAHRLYYEREYGPIREGHDLHHTCGTRDCVNPAHLTTVPHRDHGQLHGKIDRRAVCEIRALGALGWLRKDIAAAYGIHASHAGRIINGRKWPEPKLGEIARRR